jgi:hypothetical protein
MSQTLAGAYDPNKSPFKTALPDTVIKKIRQVARIQDAEEQTTAVGDNDMSLQEEQSDPDLMTHQESKQPVAELPAVTSREAFLARGLPENAADALAKLEAGRESISRPK